MVLNLRHPLRSHVFKRGLGDDREAHEKDISLWVRQRSQAIVIFLPGRIPESEVDGLSVDHDISAVVIENGGNVLSGERVCGVRDQKAGFTDSPVTNNDTLDVLHIEILLGVSRFQKTSFFK